MDQRIDLVDRYQRRLLEIIGSARPLITSNVRNTDLVGLRWLRQEMIETLAAYAGILQERAENAEGRGDGCDLLRASELRDRCLAMGTSYEAFRARWAHRHALDHWPEYRLSAVHMMKRIRDDVVFSNALHRTGIVPAT